MRLGMIDLGRMGSNMVRRLLRAGHECVVFDVHPEAADDLAKSGATTQAPAPSSRTGSRRRAWSG
jgi:6-phosphogluconate dehydrogenase